MVGIMNPRSQEIFRHVVDAYVETGEPIGSRTLSRRLGMSLSPATIRNVMADLEEAGLLYAPHISAGRLPTEIGLRIFVDGLLQVGSLSEAERLSIDAQCETIGANAKDMMEKVSDLLAGLSQCAGLVLAPKTESPLKHIEFVQLGSRRALVVMVCEDGHIENRVVNLPPGTPHASLIAAGNYLSSRLTGYTLAEAGEEIREEIALHRSQLDDLTQKVVTAGMAIWAGDSDSGALIIRGQHKLLDDVTALADLGRLRLLFETLERKEAMLRLVEAAAIGEGVQIFVGTQSEQFALAGCSVIIAPFKNSREQIIGAIGVIGPTRINYARIIPTVDYTAQVISRLIRRLENNI